MFDEQDYTMIFIGVILFAIVIGLGWFFYFEKNVVNKAYVTDTVLNEQRVCSGNNSDCKYLIYGKKETYQDTDSWWYWKFNSSDIFGHIKIGKTYKFEVVGWRIPFLSWYRNIIAVQ